MRKKIGPVEPMWEKVMVWDERSVGSVQGELLGGRGRKGEKE